MNNHEMKEQLEKEIIIFLEQIGTKYDMTLVLLKLMELASANARVFCENLEKKMTEVPADLIGNNCLDLVSELRHFCNLSSKIGLKIATYLFDRSDIEEMLRSHACDKCDKSDTCKRKALKEKLLKETSNED